MIANGEVELYGFEDVDGREVECEPFGALATAEAYAQEHGYLVIIYRFEYADSEPGPDHRERKCGRDGCLSTAPNRDFWSPTGWACAGDKDQFPPAWRFNDHRNDLGDGCGWSGEPVPNDAGCFDSDGDPLDYCPGMCRGSAVEEVEG